MGIQGDFCPIPECIFAGIPRYAGRALRDSRCSVGCADGPAALPPITDAGVGDGATGTPGIHAVHDRLPIRRLSVGRCAPAMECFRSISPPGFQGG